ncbi:MAG: GGDEF domain-containing protein [Thiomicrorhabdus sp.]|nr:GGDEF domain-containing protein [Thiomicrorhabdus sp.]
MQLIKNKNVIILWILAVFIVLATMVFWLYGNTKTKLYNNALLDYQKDVARNITGLIEDNREASMAIALALSESTQVHDFLQKGRSSNSFTPPLDFESLIAKMSLHTHYRGLWFQVLDNKGVSRYRSWTKNYGDSLVAARSDLREMLRAPQVIKSVSVGKFSLTLKSMVPLFDSSHQLLGIVETISHMTPMSENLRNLEGISSVILVDKRYHKQLTKAQKERFINDYYVANGDAETQDIEFLKHLGERGFMSIKPVKVEGDKIITKQPIFDDNGFTLGYWFTFQSKYALSFMDVEQLKRQYLYAAVALLVLTLFVMLLYVLKQSSDKSLRYYRHVLDSASEIIFVSNYQRMIEANQQFFEFYSEFSDVSEFIDKYECVCNTFLEEPGFLHKEQDGEYWLDYVLQHPNKRHKVQILKDQKVHCFEIKVALISIYEKPLYSVIMHDITSEEEYRQQLEFLSETDTLTGIANRLIFNRTLVQEIQRAHRYHLDLSLIIFDVDFFKNINDTYGHEVGDQVLITLGEVISDLLRETDVFCRIGGEEFTVIMPETNLEKAKNTAERLRLAIENLPKNTLPTQLTLSFGVADMTRWDNDKTLFKRADKALYRAKENGRNRVEVADHETEFRD